MKFVLGFIALALAVMLGIRTARRQKETTTQDASVEANERLIGYASLLLLLPLAAEVVTGIRPGLTAHALIGFLLIPPVLLKLGGVGYRFLRYYSSHPSFVAAGPPQLIMRLIGPIAVLVTVVLFGTGVELWLFGFRFGAQWLTWHKLAFVIWMLAMAVHVSGYVWRAPQLAFADSRDSLAGAFQRRSLVVGSLVVGLALALVMLPFASPFHPFPGAS